MEPARRFDPLLVVAVVLFLVLGWRIADAGPTWHEGAAAAPNNGHRVVSMTAPAPAQGLPIEPTCDGGVSVRVSSVRPVWVLCVGDQALPLMVTSYASGLLTFPLALLSPWHHDDTFTMRRLWLLEGALCIVALYRLVQRLGSQRAARATAFALATSSAFVVPCAFLFPYETSPLVLVLLGAWLWSPAQAPPWRAVLGAFCFGLALLSNVKAVFLLVPLAVLAWREGVRFPKGSPPARAGMAAAFVLGALPLLVFAFLDPARGLSMQATGRLSGLLSNLNLAKLGAEGLALYLYAADLPALSELSQRGGSARFELSWLPMAIPVTWCMAVAVARLAGKKLGSPLSGAAGVLLLSFVAVSWLLYDQHPAGNYAPLFAVFGLTVGALVYDLEARRPRLAVAAAAVLCASTAWNLVRRGDLAANTDFSFNANVQRDLAAFLRERPDAERPVLTVTYNQSGVLDALGHGRVRTYIAHPLFETCGRPGEDVEACVTARWSWLLSHRGALPMRVVLPVGVAAVDHPRQVIERLEPRLLDAAAAASVSATVEGTFKTPSGAAGVVLYRLAAVE